MKMMNVLRFGVLVWAVLPVLAAFSQQTSSSTAAGAAAPNFSPSVAEVVKLAQAGTGDDVVVAFIKNAQAPFNLSANDIVALKDAGLSPAAIRAMLDHDNSLPKESPPVTFEQKQAAPQPPAPAIPDTPSVPVAKTVPDAPTIGAVSTTNAAANPAQPSPPGTSAVVERAPPAAPLQVIPAAPGAQYYWVPGYWGWNGGWVWVGGRWVVRPWHGAIWVGGHWARHGRGYIWISGHWR